MLLYDGDQLKCLLVCCFSVCVSSVLPWHSNQKLQCASWQLMVSVSSWDSSITPSMPNSTHIQYVCKANTQKVNILTSGMPTTKSCFKFNEKKWSSVSNQMSSKNICTLDQNNVYAHHVSVVCWSHSADCVYQMIPSL